MTNKFLAAQSSVSVPCPVCDSSSYNILFQAGDYEYKLPGEFFICCCDNCGLIYQNPRPEFSEVLRYYTEKYEPFLISEKEVGSVVMRKLRQRFLVLPRIKKYLKLFENIDRKIDVLDVGCASGDLLVQLQQENKFNCQGVEPVEYAAELAKKRGLNVHCCTLEELQTKEGSFDLIIMNHVLEHLPNPLAVVEKAFLLLRKGGVLSGEIPCSDSWERILFGRYWGMYHLPRHLTFFSKKLTVRFFDRVGFEKVIIKLQPVPSAWQASVRNYLHDKQAPVFLSKIFSGHSLPLNLLSFPFAFISAKLGYAPILHFTAIK